MALFSTPKSTGTSIASTTHHMAGGPFQGILPFLSIDRITLSDAGVQLVLSNEIAKGPGFARKIITFGNFVFFSSNKTIIEDLNVSDAALKTKILREHDNIYYFTLDTEKDFKLKAVIEATSGITVVNNTHTQIYPMDLSTKTIRPNMNTDLYVLVVSFAMNANNNITIGSVLKETILIAGRSPLENELYKLEAAQPFYGHVDSTWPATAHIQSLPTGQGAIADAPMAGRFHTTAPHPTLSSDRIINVKARDMRIIPIAAHAAPQIITPSRPSATNVPNLDLPASVNRDPATETLAVHTGPTGYFSPLHTSRNRDGVVYGYFAFDIYDYFKENSLFGKYIQNDAALAACMEVIDIKIWRRTTKKLDIRSNKLTAGGTKTGLCKIMTSAADYPYISVATLHNGVEMIKKFNDGEIVGIAFRDDNAAQYASAAFEYSAEVLLVDRTKEVFETIESQIALMIKKTNIDASAGSDLVGFYMASIEFLKGADGFGDFTKKEWQKNLLTLVSKFALAPNEKGFIVNSLIRSYGLAIKSILNSNQKDTKSTVADFHSSIYRIGNATPLRAKTELNGAIEVNNPMGVGLSYIDDYLGNTTGVIPTITYQTMQQRILAEEEKYPEATENAQTTNSFGYLSPTEVSLGVGNPPIDTTSQNIELGGQEAIFAHAPPTTVPAVDTTPSSQANGNAAVLSSLGVSISSLSVSLNRLVAVSELVTPQTANSSEILGENSSFNVDGIAEQEADAGSEQSIINVHQEQEGAFTAYAGALANHLLGEEFNNFNLPAPPAPAGASYSLAANIPAANQIPVEPVPTALNFGALVRVEYLTSYGVKAGIGAENWSILTDVAFDTAVENSEMLICRLTKVDESFGGDPSENTIWSPLATLFVIGPLGNIKIEGKYGPLLRSYIVERTTYANEFSGFTQAYENEVFYAQIIPMDMTVLGQVAAIANTPAPTSSGNLGNASLVPNSSIPPSPAGGQSIGKSSSGGRPGGYK
jgi:hypothetical protein